MNISFAQILILLTLAFLFFGDISSLKKKSERNKEKIKKIKIEITEEKGLEPLTFGFGNHYSTN